MAEDKVPACAEADRRDRLDSSDSGTERITCARTSGLEFHENQRTKGNQRDKLDSDNPAKPAI